MYIIDVISYHCIKSGTPLSRTHSRYANFSQEGDYASNAVRLSSLRSFYNLRLRNKTSSEGGWPG